MVVVTIQTVMLMASNHEAAGGESFPPVYEGFLRLFDVLQLGTYVYGPRSCCAA